MFKKHDEGSYQVLVAGSFIEKNGLIMMFLHLWTFKFLLFLASFWKLAYVGKAIKLCEMFN